MIKFSEIKRCTKNNSYDKSLIGKYISQVFDENGNYIKTLIADSYKEVVELQRTYKEEKGGKLK